MKTVRFGDCGGGAIAELVYFLDFCGNFGDF